MSKSIPSFVIYPLCVAGFPYQVVYGGMFFVTTLPAPINAYSPISTPATTVLFAPIDAPFFIKIPDGTKPAFLDLGTKSLVKVTLGPTQTWSSNVTHFR